MLPAASAASGRRFSSSWSKHAGSTPTVQSTFGSYIVLDAINQDAQEWAQAWNAHRLHVRGSSASSPREMFMFGMATDGPRGFDLPHDADPDDLASYGIDWAALANPVLMRHHREDNPELVLMTLPSQLPHSPLTSATSPVSRPTARSLRPK